MENKTNKSSNIIKNVVNILLIILVAGIIVAPLIFSNRFGGHDFNYHVSAIKSLCEAWDLGSFGNKIYELTCQDFGYGTGLFYTMLPAGIAVIFMKGLHLSIEWALGLEFFTIFALSGILVYIFSKRIFKNNLASIVTALIYEAFPYFITNVYIRFAYSEIFVMLVLPLILFGIYELIEHRNYKAFIPLFTVGVSLGILTHLTMTIYICIFVLIYICLNFKKFIKGYNWLPFAVSCGLILFITASFYLPMVLNLGGVTSGDMAYLGGWLWVSVFGAVGENFLTASVLVIVAIYIIFCAIYFNKSKVDRVKDKKFFILVTILMVWASPLFPWFLVLIKPFTMIQYAWRMFNLSALAVAGMAGYIAINLKNQSKLLLYCFLSACLVVQGVCFVQESYHRKGSLNSSVFSLTDSCTTFNEGIGTYKHGDYYPKGATNEYVFNRANSMIKDGNVGVSEFANYQTLNQINFQVYNTNNSYVVLNVPYSVCEDIKINQNYFNNKENLLFESVSIEDEEYLKINFVNYPYDSRIIISYVDNGSMDNYLKQNPFEFVVKGGQASFKNYEKTNASKYSVDIEVNEKSTIELPTLFYKGYKITLTTENGVQNITPVHGENGFVEVEIENSGTLNVEFSSFYLDFANIVSIIGVALFALVLVAIFAVPRKFYTAIGNFVTKFFKEHKQAGEILRFIIVGGIATIIDMFLMGVTMYLMQRSIYPSFINVFINTPNPSTLATIMGSAVGFCSGLIVNYILSILFVFNEKGKSKSAQGFIVFTVLSVIGLGINLLGMFIGYDLLKLNQWLVKIVMVIVVLIYNYISKKLVLFKNKKPNKAVDENNNVLNSEMENIAKTDENSDKTDKN